LHTGTEHAGGGELDAPAPLGRIPVWVRRGALLVTYPAEHVARGLGDTPERERPLEVTLYGEPNGGRARVNLADGTRIRYERGELSVSPDRQVAFRSRT
jgi:alpha-glucosidase (family GH31 glycosyl hydrolase)